MSPDSQNSLSSQKRDKQPPARKARKDQGNSDMDLREIMKAYTQSPELYQALDDFRAMRKQIRKPLTSRALRSILADLDKLAQTDADKVAILDQSIKCCWQAVYELKQTQDYGKFASRKRPANADAAVGASWQNWHNLQSRMAGQAQNVTATLTEVS